MLHNELKKKNGKAFVALFLGLIAVTGFVFCYAMLESFKSRPQIKIEDESK